MLVFKNIYFLFFIIAPILLGANEPSVVGGQVTSKVQSKTIGPSQYEVTCSESSSYCIEEFKKLCVDGFNIDGYFRNEYDHGQITVVIECQNSTGN